MSAALVLNLHASMFVTRRQVPVTSWFDDPNDTELMDLIPFFEALDKVDNVLSVLGQNHSFQAPSSSSPSPSSSPFHNPPLSSTAGQQSL